MGSPKAGRQGRSYINLLWGNRTMNREHSLVKYACYTANLSMSIVAMLAAAVSDVPPPVRDFFLDARLTHPDQFLHAADGGPGFFLLLPSAEPGQGRQDHPGPDGLGATGLRGLPLDFFPTRFMQALPWGPRSSPHRGAWPRCYQPRDRPTARREP